MHETVYHRLAAHLSALAMGLPATPDLVGILERTATPAEAELMLLLPTGVAPLSVVTASEVAAHSPGLDVEDLERGLQGLLERRLVYSETTPSGERGYGLLQSGFGFPQTFFWAGDETEEAREMAGMVAKYANRHVLREMYAATTTKAYRYVPVEHTLTADTQAVYPKHAMEAVLAQATTFAVAHCPCRMAMRLRGHGCDHPLEVCLKFDELAEYVVERGLARMVTREEAEGIVAQAAEAGLVHFVDNAAGHVKHNCNCCGDACWNVGTIRRRKIPRDALMATYFLRTTNDDECTGCGVCVDVCPVQALTLVDDVAHVDLEWCIGCGVCVPRCPTGAAGLRPRTDVDLELPADFVTLHQVILEEKSVG